MADQEKPYKRYRSSRFRPRRSLRKDLDRNTPPAGQAAGEGTVPERQPGPPAAVPSPTAAPAPRARRRFGWRKLALYGPLTLLVALLVVAGISYWRVDRAVRESNARVPEDAMLLLDDSPGMSAAPVNILFIGSDQRPGESARADTLLLLRADSADKSIAQLSIPRDTLADIPGYGEGKINSAYNYGGPALQIEAVEGLTGLPVHHYVEVDFAGFPAIVDSFGGVEIEVPEAIDSPYPDGLEWSTVHFDAGPQMMDGETALKYVRVRYSDDDFRRMGRQQQFMEALQKRATSPANLARLPLTAPAIIGNITTDMTTPELMQLAWVKFRTPESRTRSFVLDGYGQDIGGVSYVVLDEEASQATIRDFLGSG